MANEDGLDELTTGLETFGSKKYTYDRLLPGQIRTLLLSPGKEDDALEGSLEIVQLDEAPLYSAISYTWGAPIFSRTLHLSHDSYIKITESLYQALRRFRSETKIVMLWADAVCIDQVSYQSDEKSQQVSIMADIYGKAQEVLVWLGEARESDCLASWTIHLSAYLSPESRDEKTMHEPDTQVPHLQLASRGDINNGKVCQCGRKLSYRFHNRDNLHAVALSIFKRPWFQRMWVIQEVGAARNVAFFYGAHRCRPTQLFSIRNLRQIYMQSSEAGPEQSELLTSTRVDQASVLGTMGGYMTPEWDSPKMSLITFLAETCELKATVPQDRIFALRALTQVQHADALKPDYALPLHALWTHVATFVLTSEQSEAHEKLFILALAGDYQQAQPDLMPSWVPDFGHLGSDCQKRLREYTRASSDDKGRCAGGRSLTPEIVCNEVDGLLRIRGAQVTKIGSVCTDSQYRWQMPRDRIEAESDAERIYEIVSWYFKCHDFATTVISARELRPLMRELLRRGQYGGTDDGPSLEKCQSHLTEAYNRCVAESGHRDFSVTQMYNHVKILLNRRPQTFYINPRQILASTTSAQLGWVPAATLPGDIVCVFQGAPYPFVVRERGDGYCTLLGDAYIQGIEHGEAWPEVESELSMMGLK